MQFRPEIQGLRAIAVASVVVFHIWPGAVPGGFVGVDVFFVISGFLITAMLAREALETGEVSLLNFYDRRIRRIVPAATLVLVVVGIGLPFLPEVRWAETASGIIAAALYFENWLLASLAVDYLAAENVPSPVQHYWSLSIEEQFYAIWPVIMVGAAFIARTWAKRRRLALALPLLAIVSASFVASVLVTPEEPALAYFATHTRIWELGLGALLALAAVPPLSPWLAEALRIAGLGMIAAACFGFSSQTPFPGFAAALPTLGAALVIAAGAARPRWSAFPLLGCAPAQYLGGVSYSAYLWHWPLITFAAALGADLVSLPAGLAIVAATLLLSDLSKRFVEDPFRRGRINPLRVIGYGGAALAASTILPLAILAAIGSGLVRGPVATAAVDLPPGYPGAAALFGAAVPEVDAPIPALAKVKDDIADAYVRDCHVNRKGTKAQPCAFGDPDGAFHVVLVGDSHAAQWIPALDPIARGRHWRLTSYTKSGCPLIRLPTLWRGVRYEQCEAWVVNVLDALRKAPPDLLIVAQSRGVVLYREDGGDSGVDDVAAGIVAAWEELEAAGVPILAIGDTPLMPFDPGECLSSGGDCTADRAEAFRDADPTAAAADLDSDAMLVDVGDLFCTPTECASVVGNVVVWRDNDHLTATYARSAIDVLDRRIASALSEAATSTADPSPILKAAAAAD